jgi:hypothetical protein
MRLVVVEIARDEQQVAGDVQLSTPHEFSLLFGRLPAKIPPDKIEEARAGNVTLISDVQILIPVTLIPGLMRALQTQKASYESQYGAIHEPGASDAQSSSR